MRILFVASEGLPFSKTGGLADVVEALPKALVELGHEVAVVLPRYRSTKATAIVMPSLTVPMGATLRFPAIADGTVRSGVRYFFVDDPEYFDREQLYGERAKIIRTMPSASREFCRAAIELAKHVWTPDVIHCHDWQSALVPVLLRTLYENDPLLRGVARRLHHSQHGLPRAFSARHAGGAGLAGYAFPHGRAGIFRQGEFPEGRARFLPII